MKFLKYRLWLVAFETASCLLWCHCRYRKLVLWLFPAYYKQLVHELSSHACREKLPLWRRWRMREIHWELGTSSVPSDRFLVWSARGYRRKLKQQKAIVDEVIAEILAEERAAAVNRG